MMAKKLGEIKVQRVLSKVKKFALYYLAGLVGLELLVLFDHFVFGTKELLPSITEMLIVGLIFWWLIGGGNDAKEADLD